MLQADEALFQTGWFVESLATQVLVIFVIRTAATARGAAGRAAVLALALVSPWWSPRRPARSPPLGARLGFVPPPPLFFAVLVGMVLSYLALVEVVKRWFYRRVEGAT